MLTSDTALWPVNQTCLTTKQGYHDLVTLTTPVPGHSHNARSLWPHTQFSDLSIMPVCPAPKATMTWLHWLSKFLATPTKLGHSDLRQLSDLSIKPAPEGYHDLVTLTQTSMNCYLIQCLWYWNGWMLYVNLIYTHWIKYGETWIKQPLNSLWPSNTIRWHRYWPTLAQVMACCLTAPSHHLNQWWLIFSN